MKAIKDSITQMLRFRAYNPKTKTYYYWDNISQPARNIFWFFVKEENLKVQRFCGFTDKNGRDVWEGDYDEDYEVIRWCDNRKGWAFATYDHPTKDFIHCDCYSCEGHYEIDDVEFEIIGNIYEEV